MDKPARKSMGHCKSSPSRFREKPFWYSAMGVFIAVFLILESSQADHRDKVLLISSYHPGFPTFFEQVQGIKSIFQGTDILLDIEFMDTKRFPDKKNWDRFQKSLAYKLEQISPYDAILVADDNALVFALEQQKRLFEGIPIVFLGVNNIDRALAQNDNPKITGVVESVSMADTIELMIKLLPDSSKIVAIVDKTRSGQSDLKSFYGAKEKFKSHHFSDISLSKMEWAEFLNALGDIKNDTPILLLSAYQDKNNTNLLFDESLNRIQKNLAAPVFHLWHHGIGDGILGGKVISHNEQGRTAAKIVMQILNGRPVEDIKVVKESPNKYVFDYIQLKKHSLPLSLLPKDTRIINEPRSFYRENKLLLWVTAAIIAPLCFSLFIAMVNIHRRKQVQKALKDREVHLRTLIESIPDLVWVKDTKGIYLSCNLKFERFFGAKEAQIIGRTDYDFVDKKTADFFMEKDREAIAADKPKAYEEEGVYADDGHVEILETIKVPMYGTDNQLIGILGIARDITERKMAEKERKEMESELRQSHKMEAIGTLAGGIAHDFNNILGIIIGNTDLAMGKTEKDGPLYLKLAEIKKAGLRAGDIVRQLLNYSRKTEPAKENIDICSLSKDWIRLLRASIPTSIDIQFNLPDNLKTIYADATQIHQVLINLCTNGAHAMEKNGGTLEIQLSEIKLDGLTVTQFQQIDPGEYIQITVSDTGHGIDPRIQARIFDPYFTTKPVGKGTGMGLSVVLGIVKSHNGAVSVYSDKERGTSFKVLFPVAKGKKAKETASMEELPGGDETILIIDDEIALLKIGKSCLESMGYKVETSTDPSESLALFQSDPSRFDLIITDMTMPGLTGEQLAKEILKINPATPVILCTGFSSQIDREKAMEIGVRSYLEKPIETARLARSVRKALE